MMDGHCSRRVFSLTCVYSTPPPALPWRLPDATLFHVDTMAGDTSRCRVVCRRVRNGVGHFFRARNEKARNWSKRQPKRSALATETSPTNVQHRVSASGLAPEFDRRSSLCRRPLFGIITVTSVPIGRLGNALALAEMSEQK